MFTYSIECFQNLLLLLVYIWFNIGTLLYLYMLMNIRKEVNFVSKLHREMQCLYTAISMLNDENSFSPLLIWLSISYKASFVSKNGFFSSYNTVSKLHHLNVSWLTLRKKHILIQNGMKECEVERAAFQSSHSICISVSNDKLWFSPLLLWLSISYKVSFVSRNGYFSSYNTVSKLLLNVSWWTLRKKHILIQNGMKECEVERAAFQSSHSISFTNPVINIKCFFFRFFALGRKKRCVLWVKVEAGSRFFLS